MSYVELTDAEIAAGKPVTSTLTAKIKENFVDHEDRIADLESGSAVDYPPIIFRVNGPYGVAGARTSFIKTTCNFAFRITGVRLLIDTAGSSGATEIDILKKSGVGAFVTVLTTKPSVSTGAGNDSISSNGVVDTSNDDVLAGDILRLDITSVQTGTPRGFLVRIDYVKV